MAARVKLNMDWRKLDPQPRKAKWSDKNLGKYWESMTISKTFDGALPQDVFLRATALDIEDDEEADEEPMALPDEDEDFFVD